MLLAGHASVRMPSDGLTIVGAHGTMTLIAEASAAGGDLRERIAREVGCAQVEKLSAVRSGVAYGAAPQFPRLVERRALVYVTYAEANRGPATVLRFYVDEDGFDQSREWARLARDVAQSIEIYPEPVFVMLGGLPEACRAWHAVRDVEPTAPANAVYEVSRLGAYWMVWSDTYGYHAEIVTPRHVRDLIVVRCFASTPSEIDQLRADVEAALR